MYVQAEGQDVWNIKFILWVGLALLFAGVSACQTGGSKPSKADATRKAIAEKECAMYFAVNKEMLARGMPELQSLVSGCNNTDLVVDITQLNPPPQITSRFGVQIYDRMLARGMPVEIANEVRNSRAFLDVVESSDAFYGS